MHHPPGGSLQACAHAIEEPYTKCEMEAEWSAADDCWLPTSLITECTDSELEIREFGGELRSFWATELGTDLPRGLLGRP